MPGVTVSPEDQHHVTPGKRQILAKFVDDVRRDPALGRSALLRTIAVTVAVITVATVMLTVLALSSSASTADKLAAAGDVLVGATLVLAGIAAVVTLLAYAVSTGSPDLQIRVSFNFSDPNNPEFEAHVQESRDVPGAILFADQKYTGNIQIRNKSSYSAKNPAVIARLCEMVFLRDRHDVNWPVIDFADTDEITAVQWDGGPSYSIHGNSTRRLPDLQLDRLHTYPSPESPALAIELLADGYRKEILLPVYFIVDDELRSPRQDREANPEWM
jgi:hypothetical protein